MKILATRSAIKIIYMLLAIDGTVDAVEHGHYISIGMSIDPMNFIDYSEDIEYELKRLIINAGYDEFDIILRAVDEELTHEATDDDQGITPRLLVWNLIVSAYSNGAYEDSEKSLIDHVASELGVDNSVVLEMEQMLKTIRSIQTEMEWIGMTERSQEEIKATVAELEKRQNVIAESAEYLIADEIDADNPYEYKPDFFDKAKSGIDKTIKPVTNKIGETVKPVTEKVGNTVKPVADKVSSAVSPVASRAKEKTGEMFGKLADKFKHENKEDK